MPFGLQPIHILVIVVAALLIFGPARLPEIGRGLGKALNEFRNGTREMAESFREEVNPQPGSGRPPDVIRPLNQDGSQPAATSAGPQVKTVEEVVCPQCQSGNPAEARFCNHCGAALQA